MKVVILAGGLGTRLGSITESIPKPMVPIGDRPILWHIMKTYAHYGFDDFVLALGYKQEVIKQYFATYHVAANDFRIDLGSERIKWLSSHSTEDWAVSLIDTGLNNLKGSRLKQLEPYLDDVNLLTYGDGVADIDIQKLVDFHRSHGRMLTITGVHPPARFGEIMEENRQLVSFKEKPQSSVGLINGGYWVFNKELLDYVTLDEDCDLEYNIFDQLVEQGQVMVYKHLDNWECVDTEREMRHLNKLWNEGKAFWKVWDK